MKRYIRLILTLLSAVIAIFGVGCAQPTEDANTVNVYILAGQSNAVGCSNVSEIDEKYNQKSQTVWLYQSGGGTLHNPDNIQTDKVLVRVRAGYGQSATLFGPEVGMAEVLETEFPDKQTFIIKSSWGNTALYDDWRSPSAGTQGKYYTYLLQTVEAGLQEITALGYTPKLQGLVWLQGEKDAMYADMAVEYADNLAAFIADIRAALQVDLPVVLGKNNDDKTVMPYCETVIAAQRKVAEETPRVTLVDTTGFETYDGFHYTGEFALELGRLLMRALLK